MAESEVCNDTDLKYICDLSAVLYKTNRIFDFRIDNDFWVLFSPDRLGLPVLTPDWVHSILDSFHDGACISDVLYELQINQISPETFDKNCAAIRFLEEKGFLRDKPSNLPYEIPIDSGIINPNSLGFWIHITNNCNLDCSYCFVEGKSNTSMSVEVIKSTTHYIANTAKLLGTNMFHLSFAGGEPTLAIPLMEIFQDQLLEELKGTDIKFSTSVLSNGTIVNERLISLLKRPNIGIGISLDGFENSHNTFRVFKDSRTGSWDVILQNIEILRKNSVIPSIMATISRETSSTLPQLVKWACENKFKTHLSIVQQTNCSLEEDLQREECKSLINDLIEAFEMTFAELEDPNVLIDPAVDLSIEEFHFDYPASGACCGVGNSYLVIKPNGHIVTCPTTIHEVGVPPSDNLTSCFKGVFDYLPSQRKYESLEDDCLNCKWFPVCAGGCPMMNLRINGHPFTKSPMCEFFEYIIPRYLIFFGKKLLHTADKGEMVEI